MDVQKIRHFNRYYARILGIFDKKFLGVDFSVTEVRILGEIARNPALTAKALAAYLCIDKGYLSRILQGLEKKELLKRVRSAEDAREKQLRLTAKGEALNQLLEEKADERILQQIRTIDMQTFRILLDAMEKIEAIMGIPYTETEAEQKEGEA